MTPTCFLLWACLQLGAGVSHANAQDCGIWYMCGVLYPHQLSVTNIAGELGLQRGNWRLSLSYDGKFRSTSTDGPDLQNSTFNSCGGVPGPKCPAEHYYTRGKEQNLCAEYVLHLGRWQAEAGPCVYHATFTVDVPDWVWQSGPGQPWVLHPVNMSANKWNPGAALGLGYNFTPGTALVTDVKMCELRGLDFNLNNMPSICKGVLGETTFRFTF